MAKGNKEFNENNTELLKARINLLEEENKFLRERVDKIPPISESRQSAGDGENNSGKQGKHNNKQKNNLHGKNGIEGEEKYHILFDNAGDAIYLWKTDKNNGSFRCIEVNSQASKMTGFDQEELMRSTPFDLVYEKDTALILEFHKKLLNEGHGKISVHQRHKSGKLIPVEISSHSFTLGNEKVVLSVVRDITEREEFENELIRAKNKAEESDRLKSAFLANMSHEIRTPMNAIVGFSSLLQARELSKEEMNKFTNIIKINSEHLLSLINDIVDISKIEANQVKIFEYELNLNHMLDDLQLVMLRELNSHEAKSVEFSVIKGLPDNNALIKTDEIRLRQVLTNLVTNAIKFTERGHIHVTYTVEPQEGLKFSVEDTGIGIPENMQKEIFKRFTRVESDLHNSIGGTGLGLAIASRLLELMGGRIWVDSKPGKGTTFSFTLPYNPVHKKPKQNNVSKESKLDNTWIDRQILVVEDDPASVELFRNIFNGKGLVPLFANDGEKAIDLFNSNPDIELVFLDIRLPGMDGVTILGELKKSDKKIPIVAQTAFAMEEDRNKYINLGFDDYLPKPLSLIQLYGILSKYLD